MARRIAAGAVAVALAAAAVGWFSSGRAPTEPPPAAGSGGRLAPGRGSGAVAEAALGGPTERGVARALERLTARVEAEVAARQRLEQRLDEVMAQLAARDAAVPAGDARSMAGVAGSRDAANTAAAALASDDDVSGAQRALIAAGVDAATAAEITRRADEVTMAEMYLRDQATREQWLDTPRFSEAMAALEQQRVSVRDAIGDAAYDRYLFALGDFNRVRVEDVLSDSPAAQAGLRRGDIVLRYGETRLFAPGELVAQTRDGTIGESVRLEVVRNGERLEVDVPRGPLGLRINAAKDTPDAG